ncbi:melatonin receptor type 1B-B-like [Montipora foliosa]|uniref:melatonin receptor type 1B-B-like n=1 Tax=Montipora foliosa TaxID=591990 RepID=UPI0035F20BFF
MKGLYSSEKAVNHLYAQDNFLNKCTLLFVNKKFGLLITHCMFSRFEIKEKILNKMSLVDNRLAQDLATRTNSMIAIEAAALLIINCLALLGNGVVFIVAYRNRRRLTRTDVLIVALSSTDLLVAVTVMPLSDSAIIKGVWLYNQSLCRFQGFCLITFATASFNTLSVIAINRYYCVVKPKQYRTVFSTRNTIGFLIIVWTVTFSFLIAPLIFGADHYSFQPGKVLCVYPFEINTAYTVGLGVAFIGVPTAIMSFCYWRVYRKLRRRNRVMSERAYRLNVREANFTKTALVVVFGFALCWLPVLVIDAIDTATGSLTLPRQLYLFYTFMILSSSTINPFIYALVSKRFKEELRKVLNQVRLKRNLNETSPRLSET